MSQCSLQRLKMIQEQNRQNCWNQKIKYLNQKTLTPHQWEYLVNNYYNEYYATEADTQRRRQERNLRNNNQSIREANKNGLLTYDKIHNTVTYFYYYNTYNYKYIVHQPDPLGFRKVLAFVYITGTNTWCYMGPFTLEPNQTLAQYVQLCYQSYEGGPPFFIKKPNY